MAARCAVLASAMFAIAQACDNWYIVNDDGCGQACLGPMVGICPTAVAAATQGWSQGTCSDDTDYTVKTESRSYDMGACDTQTTWDIYAKPGAVVGVIIGWVFGALCLCGCIVAGFIVFRKRRAQGAGENAPIINIATAPAPAGAVYAQPAQAGAVYAQPAPAGAVYAQPAPAGAVYAQPAPAGAVYAQPAPAGAVYAQPAPAGTVYAQPAQAAGQPVQYGTAMPPASVVPQAVPAQPTAPHCVY